MTDWSTISATATAAGTLVLAIATFSSVRSANRAARANERALLAGIRPVLVPTRAQDPAEKIGFSDDVWMKVEGGRAGVLLRDEAIYFGMPLRNVGTGLAVLDRWDIYPERIMGDHASHRAPDEFRRLTRDLYVASGDQGFWQGALREPSDPLFGFVRDAIEARQTITIDLLYGDHEGGQRTVSRFAFLPRDDGDWLAVVSRHWNLDRADPR